MRVDAFRGELSRTARVLLALWNMQRRRKGFSTLEPRDFGPEVAVSSLGISPERQETAVQIMAGIKKEQLQALGTLFARKHPSVQRVLGLPPLGWRRREGIKEKFGFTPPTILIIDVTQKCDLSPEDACPRCFNDSKTEGQEVEVETLHQLIEQCQFMGTEAVWFSGGEPFLLAGMLIREAKETPDMLFYAFTNGWTLAANPEVANQLPGNFIPILNLTPAVYPDRTPAVQAARGRLVRAAENLQGHIFITSLAVEAPMAKDPSFPERLDELLDCVKPLGLLLLPYMPVGRAADSGLVIPGNRSATLQQLGDKLASVPLVLTEDMLRKSGRGCPAGEELGHALPLEARLKACPFSGFGFPLDLGNEVGLVVGWAKIKEAVGAFRNADGCMVYDETRAQK